VPTAPHCTRADIYVHLGLMTGKAAITSQLQQQWHSTLS